jgi:hypothetical protein
MGSYSFTHMRTFCSSVCVDADVKVFVDGKAWTYMEQMTDPINVQRFTC